MFRFFFFVFDISVFFGGEKFFVSFLFIFFIDIIVYFLCVRCWGCSKRGSGEGFVLGYRVGGSGGFGRGFIFCLGGMLVEVKEFLFFCYVVCGSRGCWLGLE